jgi:LPXTG-motif cell wall-anchored protein
MGGESLKTGEIFIVFFVAVVFIIGGVVVFLFMRNKKK